MKEAGLFFIFVLFLFALSMVHYWYVFAVVILFSLPFLKKTKRLLPLLIFLAVVSLPYLFLHPQGASPWRWLLIFNLRALAMALSTAAFFSLVNPIKALSFSRTLKAIASLSYAQYSSFKRTYLSFSQALRSRTLRKHLGKAFFPYAGAVFGYFQRLSERRALEINQALRSRGFHAGS